MTAQELIAFAPELYHVAAAESGPQILRHGLLSAAALIDLFEVPEADRSALLQQPRRANVVLQHAKHGRAVIRDQRPLSTPQLQVCLRDGMTPEEWLAVLNARVFFWLSRSRVKGLVCARANRQFAHDVLVFDTASVVKTYAERIEVSAMNTGSTQRFARPRGRATFLRIADYPYAERHRRGLEPVVELTVPRAMTDAAAHVLRVERWRDGVCVGTVDDVV